MSKPAPISIVVPVLHEETSIDESIRRIRELNADGRTPEIVIVDGDPSAGTIKRIRQEGCIAATSEPGRAVQMNRGAALTTGDILLFLHADTFLPADALPLIRACLEDDRFVGGAFDLGIASDRSLFRITEWYVRLRTRVTRVPFGDQVIFLRRAYFERIGGYRNIPIMEDVEIMTRIRKRGDRVCIIPEKVMSSARRWEKDGIIRGTLRNWMLQVLYLLGAAPERLARYYRF